MTRKSSRANKEKRSKEPEVEKFRSLEELNQEFNQRKTGGFRSLTELSQEFQEHQQTPAREASRAAHYLPRVMDEPWNSQGTGVLKKIFEGRGFGFITPEYDPHCAGDVFLHFSDVTSGGARNLGIGTWVRYDTELDPASGRLRAKNVAIIPSTPSTAASESSSFCVEEPSCPAVSDTTCAYNRDVMLGVYKALGSCSKLGNASILKLSTVPMPPSSSGCDADQEDSYLDDERLLARLEARLDKEFGADAYNMETFGACSGWSFEEAVAANEKLRIPDVEDCTTAHSGSFDDAEASERGEEDSDTVTSTSDDRRDASQALARNEACKDRTWSWEEASQQAKLLESHRHSWEVEQSWKNQSLFSSAAPIQVFQ